MADGDDRLPRARARDTLIVEMLDDEVLIYDELHQRAHCLNRAAAQIWRACDGRTSYDQLARELAAAGLRSDRAAIDSALAQLDDAGLIEPTSSWSRRSFMKHLGVMAAASVALPVVQSIVAPSVAAAASRQDRQPCTQSQQCLSGCCGDLTGRCREKIFGTNLGCRSP